MSRFSLLCAAAIGLGLAATSPSHVSAGEYSLSVDRVEINTGEFTRVGHQVRFSGLRKEKM